MTNHTQAQGGDKPLLSICIPTYNRADCLATCLASLDRATRYCRDQVEILVSDNASTDATAEVLKTWSVRLPIRYIRNAENIGGERNFFSSASYANAEYVWIFGDDDEFGESVVQEALASIGRGYDVTIANYSSWSKDLQTLITPSVMGLRYAPEYTDANEILSTFGILLGYISSVIVRKSVLMSTPPAEYDVFVPYGFPFPYCVYCGLQAGGKLAYLSEPLFRRREHNSDFTGPGSYTMWMKFFVEGPALVFEALERRGYSREAVHSAKDANLRDFGLGNVISGLDEIDRITVRRMMFRHYGTNWRYWLVWLPALVLPLRGVKAALWLYRRLREYRRRRAAAIPRHV